MAIGNFTKQLAQQALGNSAKSMIDSLSDAPKKEAPPIDPESIEAIGATILGEVKAMQNALKDDAELIATVQDGATDLRILEFYSASPQVVVMIGSDSDHNITRIIGRADTVRLTCKVVRVQAGAKPARIVFREAKK